MEKALDFLIEIQTYCIVLYCIVVVINEFNKD
jgi:hypothetical protein